ncbi:MAG: hypothetical protein ACKOZM_01545, partial [Flavobacteriales bacterium]
LGAFAQEPVDSLHRLNCDAQSRPHSNLQESLSLSAADTSQRLQLFPTVNINGGLDSRVVSSSWLGGGMQWSPNSRWSVIAGYALAGGMLPEYQERFAKNDGFIPGFGYAVADATPHLYHTHYTFGRARFRSKHVAFEIGKGKQFWGDGYRSLVLGENASPAPYFKITTNLGKLRYQNLWMQLRDISNGQPLAQSRYKYAAMHAFSYQITPRLNAALYEWVIWQNSDTLSKRGLDLYYLNPLIFYRPVEYSLGSPDNVILAGSLRFNVTESFQLYGQFVLDEFNLNLFRKKQQWWGNKVAGQFGLKWNTPVKGLRFLTEVNIARPFIYTHGSSIQAWTHINQPMGHPLGANFVENCNRVYFTRKLWEVSEQLNVAAFGRDYDADGDGVADNFGGNITRSYVNPFGGSFGHAMLQGELHRALFHSLFVGRALSENSRWQLYLRHCLRTEFVDGTRNTENWIMVGIQTRGMLQPVADY